MDVHEVIIIQQRDQDIRAPDVDSYGLICRVCLGPCKSDPSEPSTRCKNVHEEESRMIIRSLIETYAYVKIPESVDHLPQSICKNCVDFLIEMHTFRSRCRLNDDLLQKVHKRTSDKDEFDKEIYNEYKDPLSNYSNETQKLINKINDERMGIYRCKDCYLIYESKKELYVHRNEVKHSRRAASECPHCGKMFNSTVLVQHLRVHTKERPFSCEDCGASFTLKNNLKRHLKTHTLEKAFTCELCGKTFHRSESLMAHLKTHIGVEEDGTRRRKMPTPDGEFPCPQCEKRYATEEQLKIHRRNHQRSFLCTDCGKVFATKANLLTHSRVHTGERPFKCDVCNKGFTQSSSLRTHQVIHTGEKGFACKFCNRTFAVRGNLKAHERIHTGDTPHRCLICEKGFCTSSTLRKHMRKHTKQEIIDGEHLRIEETSNNADDMPAMEETEFEKMTDEEQLTEEEREAPEYIVAEDIKQDSEMWEDEKDEDESAVDAEEIVIQEYEEVPTELGVTDAGENIQVIYGNIPEGEEYGILYEGDAVIEYDESPSDEGVEVCIAEDVEVIDEN